ncbi:exopolyphosphatase [Lactobacillus pasteurii DSM 23907 = CRBIP 24.76]|uniref:RND superfamily resistance-nodulation-cell division:proton (H+) antiporter n=1 Tax=Lactobacillus pasteurii DSM 23907 = CRBIP 24.76 TaxID=1423790 RepID=I7KK91_9LACO|nr:MMPL family transporter [Lactobacillus pasteurii]KRK07968.1 exopolyphosphatase [Lactobacillus pasteurii DSM 23907 = CRBIP 24.76]TDG77867.1 hypothetical protein C5L33_001672 [Lactobacillus pasteurii]CCI84264.1 RND superfamily resistance-nodulation-cell division:proton (H+) antiporter [Lactobacillus pasteurii DSM 23907 = CRBIP 24.76]
MQKFIKNHVFSLIAWILILLVSVVTFPNIGKLTSEHSTISLPSNVESEVAQTIQSEWTKTKKNTYEVAIVFNKKNGKLTAADKDNINKTVDYLKDHKSKYGIKDVLAPDDNIATRKKLQSKDGTTWVMQLNVSKNHGQIGEIEDEISKAAKTQGVKTYVTGADILTNAFSESIQEGIKKTEAITVVFIFIVLIIVFRSPIVPLISLLTVGISFLTSFSIVTNLVEHGNFPFSNFTQVFMVIVLFGIGTDYNILLYDKFKENLGKGMNKYEAKNDALKKAGKTILYSGSSILIGFTALSLAKFSIYQSAVGVAVGVAVLLVVLLTLNPFFMAVLGEKMFWPVKKFEGETEDKLWHGISKSTLKHPIIYLIVLAVVVTPFMLMYSGNLNYDDTAEISDTTPAKAGLLIVQKHFSKGMAEPSYVYIKSDHKLDNETDLKVIDQITKQLQASKGVSFATSVTEPYGDPISKLYVNDQLSTVNNGVDQVRTGLNKLGKGSQKASAGASQLASGASSLASGTTALQSGSSSLQTGASSLATGTSQLVSGLNELNTKLASQMSSANKTQLAQLEQALPKINQGLQQLNQQVSGLDISALTSQLNNLQSSIQAQEKAKLTQIQSAYTSDFAGRLNNISGLTAAQKQAIAQAAQASMQTAMAKAATSSTATTSQSGQGNSLSALSSQVAQLQASVKTLAAASNQALPGAATALNNLSSGLAQVQSATSQGLLGAQQLQTGANKLSAGAGQLNTGLASAQSGANKLSTGADTLASSLPKITTGLDQANSGLAQGGSYLQGLQSSAAAKTFYIPKEFIKNEEFQKSIKVYLSPDKKSAQIIVVFNSDPSAPEATKRSQELSAMVRKSLRGTSLSNAKVAMGGQSSRVEDTKNVASGDFLRTAAIMLVGIGIALIFVTRSLLQPVYIMGTLLIAYLVSLSVNQWIVQAILNRDKLAWNTPFFSFIMLIALGVDYSIFLMTRYRDLESEFSSPSQRILTASGIIGTVVISAVVILGGTFAALIPSGIPTLIEVALTVIIGLIILVFILPITLSAGVKLTYEGIDMHWGKKKKHAE